MFTINMPAFFYIDFANLYVHMRGCPFMTLMKILMNN